MIWKYLFGDTRKRREDEYLNLQNGRYLITKYSSSSRRITQLRKYLGQFIEIVSWTWEILKLMQRIIFHQFQIAFKSEEKSVRCHSISNNQVETSRLRMSFEFIVIIWSPQKQRSHDTDLMNHILIFTDSWDHVVNSIVESLYIFWIIKISLISVKLFDFSIPFIIYEIIMSNLHMH